jgi:hypothetical protein
VRAHRPIGPVRSPPSGKAPHGRVRRYLSGGVSMNSTRDRSSTIGTSSSWQRSPTAQLAPDRPGRRSRHASPPRPSSRHCSQSRSAPVGIRAQRCSRGPRRQPSLRARIPERRSAHQPAADHAGSSSQARSPLRSPPSRSGSRSARTTRPRAFRAALASDRPRTRRDWRSESSRRRRRGGGSSSTQRASRASTPGASTRPGSRTTRACSSRSGRSTRART